MERANSSPALSGDALVVEVQRLARAFAVRQVRKHVADDIAQGIALECLIRVRRGTWSVPHAHLTNFVSGMVSRRVVDAFRRQQAFDERNAEHARDLADSEHAWMSPECAIEERELAEIHARTLRQLPAKCRRSYLMVREDGESYKTVATRLGISRSTVCAHVVTAQRRLRKALSKRGARV